MGSILQNRFTKASGQLFDKNYHLLTNRKIDKQTLTQDHQVLACFLALSVFVLVHLFLLNQPFHFYQSCVIECITWYLMMRVHCIFICYDHLHFTKVSMFMFYETGEIYSYQSLDFNVSFFHLLIPMSLCNTYLKIAKLAKVYAAQISKRFFKIWQYHTRPRLWQNF